jgi:hypothetical protein
MKIIEPTHKEVMQNLRCCHYGYLNKNSCICHNHKQFKGCYERMKKSLTTKIYTADEIAEQQKNNNKAMEALKSFLNEFEI